jgi:Zn finger protein HypA/HybF involved in hydrogenase expression
VSIAAHGSVRTAYWSHAGGHLQLQESEEAPPASASEIVLIGLAMDEIELRNQLQEAVVTAEEAAQLSWTELDEDCVKLRPRSWMQAEEAELAVKRSWLPIALVLATLTILYNIAEGAVSIKFGVEDDSPALLGFGADSWIEVLSAALVFWRFVGEELMRMANASGMSATMRERFSTFSIGMLLLALGLLAVALAIYNLVNLKKPETTTPGIIISCASLSFMFSLYFAKLYVAIVLDSSTLEKDAACSLGCIKLSFVLLLGSALYKASEALWWVDSAVTIVIGLFLSWEGAQTLRAALRTDFDGCVCCGTSFAFVYKRLHARIRTKSGALLVSAWGKPKPAVEYTESKGQPQSGSSSAACCPLCASTQHKVRDCSMLDPTSALSPFASLQQRWADEWRLVLCKLCNYYGHETRECPLLDCNQPHDHAMLQQRWSVEDYGPATRLAPGTSPTAENARSVPTKMDIAAPAA